MLNPFDILKVDIEKNFPHFTGSIEIHVCEGEVGTIKKTESTRYALKRKPPKTLMPSNGQSY